MKRLAILGILFLLVCNNTIAQSYNARFDKLFNAKDTAGQRMLLEKWYAEKPDDAEYYTAAFNYHAVKSREPVLSFDDKAQGKNSLAVRNNQDSTMAFLNESAGYNPQALVQAYRVIDEGIGKFPKRLDMRFGKIYMLGENGRYDVFADELVKTLQYSATINHQWLWTDNKPVKDPVTFLKDNTQSYILQLYEVGDEQADNMLKAANAALLLFPDHAPFLSDQAVAYSIKNELSQALVPLLKAAAIVPEDYIVLNNIAEIYYRLKDKENALKYYRMVLKYGDAQAKNLAKERIKELG
ncbi:MAG TPA: hypothetical protein VGD89_09220 [Flavipsychrobacter sp.]